MKQKKCIFASNLKTKTMFQINPLIVFIGITIISLIYFLVILFKTDGFENVSKNIIKLNILVGFILIPIFLFTLIESLTEAHYKELGKLTVNLHYNPGDDKVYYMSDNGSHILASEINNNSYLSNSDIKGLIKVNNKFIIYYPKVCNSNFFEWKMYTESDIRDIKKVLFSRCYLRYKEDIILEKKVVHKNVKIKE